MCGLLKNFYSIMLITLLIACAKDSNKTNFKIFKYNEAEALTSLDPAFARTQANIWACTHIYNGLVELNKDMKVKPALCESWHISPDGKTYSFKLKKGIKFSDDAIFPGSKGREFDAYDVYFSFKRIIDSTTASTGAWIFNDKLLLDNKGKIADTSFKVVDKYTFKIYLQKSYPPFLQLLAMPYAYIIAKESVLKYGKEYRMHPVGTGPFCLKSWEEGNALLLNKNTNYWKKDAAGNSLPYLDIIHISFINDRNIAFYSFLQKKIDFVSGLDENSRDMVFNYDGTIKKKFSEKYSVQQLTYLNTEYLGFHLDKENYSDKSSPILDRKIRMALNYAVDKQKMVKFLLNNVGIAGTQGFVPPFLLTGAKSKVHGYEYNLNKALQLLKEAGFPQGNNLPTITLSTIARFPYKEMAEFMQREWSKVGIKVKIEINTVPNHTEMMSNGKLSFFRASWLGDYPDAENYLTLFYSKNFSPKGPNRTHFKNKAFDILYEKSLNEQNDMKRTEIYAQMDQIIMNEAPIIVLFYDQVVRMTQKYIVGLEANAMNALVLERVDIMKQTTK
jgi:ABC-type transport system substrate-binding protein